MFHNTINIFYFYNFKINKDYFQFLPLLLPSAFFEGKINKFDTWVFDNYLKKCSYKSGVKHNAFLRQLIYFSSKKMHSKANMLKKLFICYIDSTY